jgi:N-acetylglucosamine-6-phosphate deacetylase
MTGRHAVPAATLFDGVRLQHDRAAVIEAGRIVAVVPRGEVPATMPVAVLPEGAWLAPGFIDTQVNGGGDVLFNDAPTPEAIAAIAAAHRRFGTTALLPTLISDTPAKMRAALAAADEAARTQPGVLGIHLEGPFLSPEKPGVHDPSMLRAPDATDAELIAGPVSHPSSRKPSVARLSGTSRYESEPVSQGPEWKDALGCVTPIRLVTLAPERVPAGFIARLVAAGVRVALGHSAATYAETRAAMSEGLTGFTHLFNAMRPLGSREPGPIAAALESPDAWFGMIVDGHHVAPAMLRLALRGAARPMLVTDAMPPVGGRRSDFALNGRRIRVEAGRCTAPDGRLAGAALGMADAVRNCVELLGVPLPDALRFASAEPAAFLGLGETLGRIAPGYRADLVAFDPADIAIHQTWVAGRPA